ncbi:MAG: helix-turn-helix domain-containing protein [Rhodospirillales bacterium]
MAPPVPSASIPPPYEIPGLINETRAAQVLGLKVSTLRRWRWLGQGPRFIKVGTAVRYDPADVEAFIAAGRRRSTSDPGEAA